MAATHKQNQTHKGTWEVKGKTYTMTQCNKNVPVTSITTSDWTCKRCAGYTPLLLR